METNHFSYPTAAERYAQDRPYFHPLAIQRIRSFLKLKAPVPVALDVACGTGQSSLALAEIAQSVIGIDSSEAMLSHAPAHPRIRYLQASAEQIPLESHSADLVSVTLAFHWLDRIRFLAEARRVLRPGGSLVIIAQGMRSWLFENKAIAQWFEKEYFPRFPAPPRHKEPLTDEVVQQHGFAFFGHEPFLHELSLSPGQMARNLTTHSNVIAVVEGGSQALGDIVSWIVNSLQPMFTAPTERFIFGGEISYLRPLPVTEAAARV